MRLRFTSHPNSPVEVTDAVSISDAVSEDLAPGKVRQGRRGIRGAGPTVTAPEMETAA